jgi:AcrR family transcriptional regulator/DNA-binding transcriptional regulator YhcF (GntR family)
MAKSLTEAARAVLMQEETALAATLKPGSKSVDPAQTLGSATKLADPVIQPNGTDGSNLGAAAAAGIKTDTSVKKATKPEPMKKKAEVMEEDVEEVAEENQEEINEEDDVELSEELESFIDQCLEEGMDEDQIAEAIEENFEFVTEESEEDVMENYEVDMSEHVDALLAGEELSEEFREKATAIFEAAVKQKVAEEIAVIEEAFAATLEEEVGRIEEELSTNVDDYLNYVVEQWTAENEVAIEASLRSELTEEFISGLRNLFVEHYIDIPEEAVSVVEEMGNKVAELEEKLNEEIERSVTLSKMLNESQSNEILLNACDGLTDTQAEKLKSLAEGIEYADANEYAQKVSILKENYFSTSVKSGNVLDAAESSTDGRGMISEELNGPMAAYVRSLGKTQLR